MTNILLISEDKIKTELALDDNLYSKHLLPAIKQAQEIELQSIIGTSLLNHIYELIENNLINEDENIIYKSLIDNHIQDYLMYQTLVEIIPILAVKLDNIGVVINQDEKVTNISKERVDYLISFYQYKADFFKKRLQDYLCKNYNLYSQYLTCDCAGIKPNLKDTESCNIFLGGIYHK